MDPDVIVKLFCFSFILIFCSSEKFAIVNSNQEIDLIKTIVNEIKCDSKKEILYILDLIQFATLSYYQNYGLDRINPNLVCNPMDLPNVSNNDYNPKVATKYSFYIITNIINFFNLKISDKKKFTYQYNEFKIFLEKLLTELLRSESDDYFYSDHSIFFFSDLCSSLSKKREEIEETFDSNKKYKIVNQEFSNSTIFDNNKEKSNNLVTQNNNEDKIFSEEYEKKFNLSFNKIIKNRHVTFTLGLLNKNPQLKAIVSLDNRKEILKKICNENDNYLTNRIDSKGFIFRDH